MFQETETETTMVKTKKTKRFKIWGDPAWKRRLTKTLAVARIDEDIPTEAERKAGARRIIVKTAPFEVSPVIIGAGIGTGTVAVKQADGAGEEDVEPAVVTVTNVDGDAIDTDWEAVPPEAIKAVDDAAEAAEEAATLKARQIEAESAAVASDFERITRNMRKWA